MSEERCEPARARAAGVPSAGGTNSTEFKTSPEARLFALLGPYSPLGADSVMDLRLGEGIGNVGRFEATSISIGFKTGSGKDIFQGLCVCVCVSGKMV